MADEIKALGGLKPIRSQGFDIQQYHPVRESQMMFVTTTGSEMSELIYSAAIFEPGENLLTPDVYSFVVLPLPKDAKPGASREYRPTVSRTGGMGPQIADLIQEETEKLLNDLDGKGISWRWIDIGLPQDPTPELKRLFDNFHVDTSKGEELRFLAYKPKTEGKNYPRLDPGEK